MRLPPHFQLAKILHRLLGPSTAARSEQVAFPFLYARVVEIPNHRHKENAMQQFIEIIQGADSRNAERLRSPGVSGLAAAAEYRLARGPRPPSRLPS